MTLTQLAQSVKRARRAAGLTQAQLAKHSGVGQAYISHLEKGLRANPSAAVLEKIARALGVTVGDLVADPREAALARIFDLAAKRWCKDFGWTHLPAEAVTAARVRFLTVCRGLDPKTRDKYGNTLAQVAYGTISVAMRSTASNKKR
jgi:transcriptional regulator with XRE-family HTH domain